jgi:hypothetical protein
VNAGQWPDRPERKTQCTVCPHPERARELLLAKGDGYAEVARRLGLSVDALERHWKRHTTTMFREALAPRGKALAAWEAFMVQATEDGSSVLDHLKAARGWTRRHTSNPERLRITTSISDPARLQNPAVTYLRRKQSAA